MALLYVEFKHYFKCLLKHCITIWHQNKRLFCAWKDTETTVKHRDIISEANIHCWRNDYNSIFSQQRVVKQLVILKSLPAYITLSKPKLLFFSVLGSQYTKKAREEYRNAGFFLFCSFLSGITLQKDMSLPLGMRLGLVECPLTS